MRFLNVVAFYMAKSLLQLLPMLCMLALVSCRQTKVSEHRPEPVQTEKDTLQPDTLLVQEDAEQEEEYKYMDSDFDDFMFTFVRNNRLQRQRVKYPLHFVTPQTDSTLYYLNCREEFAFLNDDFFTILYGSSEQIEEVKEIAGDSVSVERIDLNTSSVNTYDFRRMDGKWMLTGIHQVPVSENELSDFLSFYTRFSTDSIYQHSRIAQPLRFGMMDPEDEGNYIEGTLDAQQWFAFCPEVPGGVISNIRYGQHYSATQVVLQKCEMASGMEEVFSFQRFPDGWMLVSYEN